MSDEFKSQYDEYLCSAEYVSPGHPDKVCDQISDTILDLYLQRDPNSRVACEVMAKGNHIYLAGEITSEAEILPLAIEQAVIDTLDYIGYDSNSGYPLEEIVFHHNITKQSPQINAAVVTDSTIMAGDQGIVFGYATLETPTYMPLAWYLAKKVIDAAWHYKHYLERKMIRPFYLPDMKSQVTVRYSHSRYNTPIEIDSVVFSACHVEGLSVSELNFKFMTVILPDILATLHPDIANLFTANTKYHINPAGIWTYGGPHADCGITGRKIVCDQYGSDCETGGGAFSGKDGSKVDRSAAYMARFIALRTLKMYGGWNHARNIKVQLSYAIGEKYPVSCRIYSPHMHNAEYSLEDIGLTLEDLTPAAIMKRFKLTSPIYLSTAHYGHFGHIGELDKFNKDEFLWEQN